MVKLRKNANRNTVENRLYEFCKLELGYSDYKEVRAMLRICLCEDIKPSKARFQFINKGCKQI